MATATKTAPRFSGVSFRSALRARPDHTARNKALLAEAGRFTLYAVKGSRVWLQTPAGRFAIAVSGHGPAKMVAMTFSAKDGGPDVFADFKASAVKPLGYLLRACPTRRATYNTIMAN